jgi:hypothetical protein
MLAKGNTALFLDIWPLHMFYKEFGLARFERCLSERANLRGSVAWAIADKVSFGRKSREVEDGFRAIDAGNIAAGVESLAKHEQFNILQLSMYDDPYFASLMRTNQFAWALNILSGSINEIQLVFANHCTVTGANAQIERFSKQPLANLANAEERMEFVRRAANRFNELLRDPLQSQFVENSLFVIAHGKPS